MDFHKNVCEAVLINWDEAANFGPEVAGGKGAQMGRLAKYGLPVVDGIVIPTDIYRATIGDEFKKVATRVCTLPEDIRNTELTHLQKRVMEQPLPPELLDAIDDLYRLKCWNEHPLAVRSSAPSEDSAQASFAGIHLSVLNVIGRVNLEDAIREVWSSLWTPQAVAYRERVGLRHEDAAMAVVIMPMVPAKMSGVIFTCDPRSGREDRMVINAVRGLGEALVSGLVNGEDIVLGKQKLQEAWNVIERRPSSATLALEPAAEGGLTQRLLTLEEQKAPVLDNTQAVALATLAQEAANAFDFSSPWYDIEWVWDGHRFLLIQARPITARTWHTYTGLHGQPSIWTNGNSKDIMPHVINACELQGLRWHANFLMEMPYRLVDYSVREGLQRVALIQGRVYFNASILQWEAYDSFGISPAALNRGMGGSQPVIPVPPRTFRQKISHAVRIFRFILKNSAMRKKGLAESRRAFIEAKTLRNVDLRKISTDEFVEQINGFTAKILLGNTGLAFMQLSGGSPLELLKRLDRKFPGESNSLAAALMAGGTPSVTAQQGYYLLRLARIASNEPEVRRWLESGHFGDWQALPVNSVFRVEFAEFLDSYGHRAVYESYSRSPRWHEDPSFLLASIAGLLDADIEGIRLRQKNTVETSWQRIASRTTWVERLVIRVLLHVARRDNNHRELARSSFTALYGYGRSMLLEAGRRLVELGLLNDREEVFHMTASECVSALRNGLSRDALQARITDRIKMTEQWEAHPASDVVYDHKTGVVVSDTEVSNEADTWRGLAVGGGSIKGRVRIIHHPNQQAKLQRGEILVAPSTDPSWLPLFLKVEGLIMETGGYLSHGAIVAREFGIPAVVNIPGILDKLHDGELVALDGQKGIVVRLDERINSDK